MPPVEMHFFDDVYSRRREFGDPIKTTSAKRVIQRISTLYGRYYGPGYQRRVDLLFSDSERLEQLRRSCSSYQNLLSTFMALQMQAERKYRWGNHTPRDIFNLEAILSFYPDVRIIFCIRDVRDFLLSYHDLSKVVPDDHVSRISKLYHPVVTTLLWKGAVNRLRKVESLIKSGNLLVVRYEDLVRDPDRVVRQICQTIGEAFEPDMLNVQANNSSVVDNRKRSTGIFDTSVGRWRLVLPNEDAYIAQHLVRTELRLLGYQPESLQISTIKTLGILLRAPVVGISGLIANRGRRGPLIPYMAKRFGASFNRSGRYANQKIDSRSKGSARE